MSWNVRRGLVFLCGSMLVLGCSKGDGRYPPQPASAASQPGFAARFDETLAEDAQGFDAAQQTVGEEAQSFSGYADALKEPCDYARAEAIVRAADEAGRSEAYADEARQRDAVEAFFAEEDGVRLKRLAGGVQYAAQQAGCNDVGSAAAGNLRRGLDKELDEVTREGNEAHALLDRHEEAIGKDNVATMRKQVDVIAEASYLTHVELPRLEHALKRHASEASEARTTLEREIEAEQERAGESTSSDAQKKASKARVAELEEAKGALDVQLEEAKKRVKTLEKDVKATKVAYDKALDGLLETLRQKAEGQGAGS